VGITLLEAVVTVLFDAYRLSDEHEQLRAAVRQLVTDKIAPDAAAVDEQCAFPQVAYDALRAAGLHAVHVPEVYGGEGADALAACLVIEEVARGCASSSLIPAVNKLGSLPLLLAGSEELKQRYLRPLAEGRSLFCYALSEPEAGSDVASMRTRAHRDGHDWVLNGVKRWITNAGEGTDYVVFAVTDPGSRGRHVSAFVVERDDPGVSFGPP
jgi:alkylation response protein AidB-like acyl-CoA dehydrogenase